VGAGNFRMSGNARTKNRTFKKACRFANVSKPTKFNFQQDEANIGGARRASRDDRSAASVTCAKDFSAASASEICDVNVP